MVGEKVLLTPLLTVTDGAATETDVVGANVGEKTLVGANVGEKAGLNVFVGEKTLVIVTDGAATDTDVVGEKLLVTVIGEFTVTSLVSHR